MMTKPDAQLRVTEAEADHGAGEVRFALIGVRTGIQKDVVAELRVCLRGNVPFAVFSHSVAIRCDARSAGAAGQSTLRTGVCDTLRVGEAAQIPLNLLAQSRIDL